MQGGFLKSMQSSAMQASKTYQSNICNFIKLI